MGASLLKCMAVCAVLIAGLCPTLAAATELVKAERKSFWFRDSSANTEREFSTAESACAAYVDSRKEGSKFTKLDDDYKDGDGSVRCLWKRKEGDTDGQTAVYVAVKCPPNSNSTNPDALATMQCSCNNGFVSSGGKCVQGGGGGSSTAAAAGTASGNPRDPCLNQLKSVDAEPDRARCPLSWRAWSIKKEVFNWDPRKWNDRRLEYVAIAVTEGVLQNGKRVIVITTNNADLDADLRSKSNRAFSLQPGEEMGFPPRTGEHAEDTAKRTLEARKVDKSRKSQMGTDPIACARCSATYGPQHPWITHERR